MRNFSADLRSSARTTASSARSSAAAPRSSAASPTQNENLAETIRAAARTLQSSNRALVAGRPPRRHDGDDLHRAAAHGSLRSARRCGSCGPSSARRRRSSATSCGRSPARPSRSRASSRRRAARACPRRTPELHEDLTVLNALFDELAYDPPGRARARRATSSTCPGRATTPTRRCPPRTASGPCGAAHRADAAADTLSSCSKPVRAQRAALNPTLTTLIRLLNAPKFTEVCSWRAGCDDQAGPHA